MRYLLAGLLASAAVCGAASDSVTLRAAIVEAISNNQALLAGKSGIAIAEARILTARLRPNPTASVSGDHLDLLGTGFNDVNAGGPGEISAGLEYTFQRGGKRTRRIEVASQSKAVAELQFDDAVRELVMNVKGAFVDALAARDGIQLARENLGFLRQIVEVNQVRVRTGDIAEIELVRSRLAALQQQAAVSQAELRYRSALVRLRTLMGRRQSSAAFAVEGTLDGPDTIALLDDMQKEALARRPDLAALRRDLLRADSEIALQQAGAKQDVTVGADYRRQQDNARANALTLSVSVPIAIFDRNQGEIARARQERRQAEFKVKALETEIAGEVETAWSQFTTARSLLNAFRGSMLESAREVREITEFSYRRGEANLLSLLDAQRAFNDTMQGYIEARAEYVRSLYQLDSVCGKDAIR
jgi:outer membrane protein, heavy metal efflux system